MTPPFVLSLSRCTDFLLVGGKAAGLARLLEASLPVPDGCCVTTKAYERALHTVKFAPAERWGRAITRSGDERRQELRSCRETIRQSELMDVVTTVWEELLRIPGARDRRWAVRSSATNEDMDRASAAGLYRTMLGVGWAELAMAIRETWASVWNERVMDYMLAMRNAEVPPAMAVVIQPLVDAEMAGVAYSIDPVTGRNSHVTINAILGLGQPLVEGSVSPDQYMVETAAGVTPPAIRRLAGRQRERLVATDVGLAMEPVIAGDRNQPVLSDQRVLEVAALTKRIEQVFKVPVDVEWAIDGERLWALQARPVTVVQPSSVPSNDDCEWSRANFKETMPELPSPMGLSFLERFMDTYILAKYRRLGCRIPPGWASVRLHAGRPYLNLTLFHLLVVQLGGDPTLNAEQMGGEAVRSPPRAQPLEKGVMLRAGWIMWREMRRVSKSGAASFAGMKALACRYSRERVRHLSLEELRGGLDELGRWLDGHEVTFGIAAGAGQCLQVFSRTLPRWFGADWRSLLNESLRGQGTVISAQQILRIAELVALAREDAVVSAALRQGWEAGRYRRSFEGSPFLEAFDRYLDEYGHRAVGESDIMSPRLVDHPETLLEVIKNQLDGAPVPPSELLRRQRAARDRALATIRKCCGWRLDRWLIFQVWYRRLCRFFTLREANRHHLMWYSLAARHLLLRLGERLVERRMFSSSEDIFFLTLDELEDLDRAPVEKWAALIRARRAEREHWRSVEAPDAMRSGEDSQPLWHQPSSGADGPLRGIPLSSGIVSGPVRFVRTTRDWSRVRPGDILVMPVIDPGMAPLFGIAGGLIAEMGGTLSHGAIIAREYGLPAIANVCGAMSILSEDEHITLDAAQGIVTR